MEATRCCIGSRADGEPLRPDRSEVWNLAREAPFRVLGTRRCTAAETCRGFHMNALSSRQFARRCRELMGRARNTAAVEQLQLWVEELGQQPDVPAHQVDDVGPGFSTQSAT